MCRNITTADDINNMSSTLAYVVEFDCFGQNDVKKLFRKCQKFQMMDTLHLLSLNTAVSFICQLVKKSSKEIILCFMSIVVL